MCIASPERRAKRWYGLRIKRRRCLASALLSLLAIFSPVAQIAHAVDLHYAGAIGQDFLPEPSSPDTRRAPVEQPHRTAPAAGQSQSRAPDLPGLGTSSEKANATGMSIWTKVLIGVAVVGTMAALSNKGGGGGGEATVSTDASSNTGGSSTPPSTGGNSPSPPATPPSSTPSPSAPSPVPSTPVPPIASPPPPAPIAGGEREDDKGKNRGRK